MKRQTLLLLSLGFLFLIQARGICWSQTTERVSVDTGGIEGDNGSNDPSISSDGRYVAFESFATNLVPGGTNGRAHIFVRDRQTGTTKIVSVHSDGSEGNFDSNSPSISSDGRYVSFMSDATNLVDDDTNPFLDIFVHDLQTVTTTRVSVDSAGGESDGVSFNPCISSDGRYVAFDSDGDLVLPDIWGVYEVFVHDRQTQTTERVSLDSAGNQGNNHSYSPSISGDGRYVAFRSFATDLIAPETNGKSHIFVRDRQTGTTLIVSVHSDGTQGEQNSFSPSISADGRYVAFHSEAEILVDDDNNGKVDIFVHDRQAGTTTRVSVASGGGQGNGHSYSPSISENGRYVAFHSEADNLVVNDFNSSADVFVHDRDADGDGIYDEDGAISTVRVSVASGGGEGNGDSSAPSISSDGKYVAFTSDSDNLVGGDNNGSFDIFTYERESLPPTVDSTSPANNANGVGVGTAITATFSEPMNGSTIDTNSFTLDNGVTGTVTYDANSTTATFTPTSKLDYDTTYIATITTAARDLAGNPMVADYTWTFTTKSEQKNSGGSGSCFIATAASDWAGF